MWKSCICVRNNGQPHRPQIIWTSWQTWISIVIPAPFVTLASFAPLVMNSEYLFSIIINNYSKSARWIWDGYDHLVSNKCEWNIFCFIKNTHKISRILPYFIWKNNQFSACFQFWVDAYSYPIWKAWYNGSYNIWLSQSEL